MRMQRTRFVLALVIVGALVLPASGLVRAENGPWIVMIYCGADGQYYTDEAIKFNLLQCQEALDGVDSAIGVRIFVFMDLDGSGNSRYLELEADVALPDMDSSDWNSVGDPLGSKSEWDASNVETLNKFLDAVAVDCGDAYALSQKLLVLKNGHAWCGICPDETDATEEAYMMPLTEIAAAVDGRGVDILAFDGDNMASIEAAYELRGKVEYMFATQQDIPIDGLPYKKMLERLLTDSCEAKAFVKQMTEDYVDYYDNRYGNKQANAHLLSQSQMAVTASAVYLGDPALVEAVVESFNDIMSYMIDNTFDESGELIETTYDDEGNLVTFPWIPTYRDCLASARDYALIGKMHDQQGYEWLPDLYTWLYGITLLVAYYDEDDPVIAMIEEDFLPKLEKGEDNLVVSNVESSIIAISGNSDAHGLNFWFPPTWLHWDDFVADDARARSYLYDGYSSNGAAIPLPAEYYCIDCPAGYGYNEIGLAFVLDSMWMDFLEVYYDSRWLLVTDPGNLDPNKP